MTIRYEELIYSLVDNARRQIEIRPLNLGGVTASGGGSDGRPGGYYGRLPQHRITYDLSEEATLSTPASGESLLDNLNHIRYRILNLEEAPSGGISEIKQSNTLVASGITVLDFSDDFTLTVSPSGELNLDIPTQILHKYNEDLSPQTPTVLSGIYETEYNYISSSVRVYYNGLRQMPTAFTEEQPNRIRVLFTPDSSDFILVDYDYYLSNQLTSGEGWGDSNWGNSPWGT